MVGGVYFAIVLDTMFFVRLFCVVAEKSAISVCLRHGTIYGCFAMLDKVDAFWLKLQI